MMSLAITGRSLNSPVSYARGLLSANVVMAYPPCALCL
jgi:hypothetical protein